MSLFIMCTWVQKFKFLGMPGILQTSSGILLKNFDYIFWKTGFIDIVHDKNYWPVWRRATFFIGNFSNFRPQREVFNSFQGLYLYSYLSPLDFFFSKYKWFYINFFVSTTSHECYSGSLRRFGTYDNDNVQSTKVRFKGSLHRFEYRNFCVNVYTCISVVRPLIHENLGLN